MKRGFTLIEILIAIGILSVLAAIAIPGFSKPSKKADANQAVVFLRAIRLAEKMYLAKNGTYLAESDANSIRTNLGAEISDGKYSFSVVATNPIPPAQPTFTATATRVSDNNWLSLDDAGSWTGSIETAFIPTS